MITRQRDETNRDSTSPTLSRECLRFFLRRPVVSAFVKSGSMPKVCRKQQQRSCFFLRRTVLCAFGLVQPNTETHNSCWLLWPVSVGSNQNMKVTSSVIAAFAVTPSPGYKAFYQLQVRLQPHIRWYSWLHCFSRRPGVCRFFDLASIYDRKKTLTTRVNPLRKVSTFSFESFPTCSFNRVGHATELLVCLLEPEKFFWKCCLDCSNQKAKTFRVFYLFGGQRPTLPWRVSFTNSITFSQRLRVTHINLVYLSVESTFSCDRLGPTLSTLREARPLILSSPRFGRQTQLCLFLRLSCCTVSWCVCPTIGRCAWLLNLFWDHALEDVFCNPDKNVEDLF